MTTRNDGGSSVWSIQSYDALGHPTASSQFTNGTTYPFAAKSGSSRCPNAGYCYNLHDELTDIRYPSGRTISTSYDQAGRISGVTGNVNGASTTYASVTTYASHGGIQQMALGPVLTEQTCYNNRLQALGIRLGSGATTCTSSGVTNSGADVLNLALGFGGTNNNGNLLSETITRGSQTWSQSYSFYDAQNRLRDASEGSNWCQAFKYGGFGNRAVLPSDSHCSNSYMPNASQTATDSNQFTNNRWSGAGYDPAGNQTSISVLGVSNTYDQENRLKTSWSAANPLMEMYSYDGEGRRVMKMQCPNSNPCTPATASSVTVFVYDAQGQLAAEYGPPSGTGTSYLTADHLGSTRVVTGTNGVAQKCYDYLPFGEEIPSTVGGRASLGCYSSGAYPGVPDIEAQKFTGQYRDYETGLDFFGSRYFSGAQGRFTSPDPKQMTSRHLLYPQKWNKYAYVQNSPLTRFDPDGDDDFYVFRPLASESANNGAWARLEASANRPGSPNHVYLYNGPTATAARFQAAVATPGAHVIDTGHTLENNEGHSGAVILGNNLAVGDTAMPPVPGFIPPFAGGPVLPVGDVQAASIAAFGCNSTQIEPLFSPLSGFLSFTGTSPGVNTEAADIGALAYTQTMLLGGSATLAGAVAQGPMQTATQEANSNPSRVATYEVPQVCTTANGGTTCR